MISARNEDTASSSSSSFIPPHQTCPCFTLSEIQSATENFDDTLVIGHGGFGKVYKCPTKIGSVNEVAVVKRLHSMSDQGVHEFEAEVKVLSKFRHGNLVSLFGYCNEGKEMVLVYEFMPNGTLKHQLDTPDCSLSWLQRLKICIGAARGLDCLHTGTSTQQGVIHRDVKSSNILLDANFDAKISDFGLAKIGQIDRTHVSTAVKGTFGYMDPCYFYTGKLTKKSDVYAFGVVLLEVLSGKKAVDSTLDEEQWGLAGWAQHKMKEGKLNQIIDQRLIGQISKRCLKEFAKIARYCLHDQPKRRPTMAEVVVKLKFILSQETESADSDVDEEGFVYKLRSIFKGKLDVKTGSRYDFNAHHTPIVIEVDGAIGSNTNEGSNTKTGSRDDFNAHHTPIVITEVDGAIGSNTNGGVRTFTYAELVSATNGFNDEEQSSALNEYIYKGWVDERTYAPTEYGVGLAMYVRKMEFEIWKQTHLKLVGTDHHNLVKLLGYCLSKHELFCVYELIPGTSLDKYLYKEPGTTSLSWVARLKIAIGAAEGLFYLHKQNHAAYSQFKTSFILVDKDFNARLSDFAFDAYTFRVERYYAAPGWFRFQADRFDSFVPNEGGNCGFAMKSEIYSFGVVLLEILTGKQNLKEWAIPLLADEVNLGMVMDPRLQQSDCPPKGAFKFAQLVSNCLQVNQDDRPSMEEILQVLNHCYKETEIKTV